MFFFVPSRRWGCAGIAVVAILLIASAASFCQEQSPLFTKDEAVPADAIVLFDGKDLSKWTMHGSDKPANWKIENGYAIVSGGSIATKQNFQDFQLHVEFRLPMEAAKGHDAANSGVYMIDDYEVQVLDSYGQGVSKHGCGALYSLTAPSVNASRPPDQWQSFDILFQAPRFDDTGKKNTDARMSVLHNGIWVHNDASVPVVTENHKRLCRAKGPIRLQDHGCKIHYRNIWIRPLPEVK